MSRCYDDFFLRLAAAFFPPLLDAFGVFAILAARSFDIPFLRRPSYCFSFLTLGRFFPGRGPLHPAPARPAAPVGEAFPCNEPDTRGLTRDGVVPRVRC
jgi:hypothetical protein